MTAWIFFLGGTICWHWACSISRASREPFSNKNILLKEESMINDVSRVSGYINQMTLPSMEMRRNDLFNKVDSNGDGGIDKVEISDLAKKLSEDTGTTLNVDDIFSTYDADGDGKLSKTELDSFMRENAPPPPGGQGHGPGSVNDASQQSRLNDLFAKVDKNSDGSISKDELSALVKKLLEDIGNT
jgi:Ca2+-binding EF-hand superfamily protein